MRAVARADLRGRAQRRCIRDTRAFACFAARGSPLANHVRATTMSRSLSDALPLQVRGGERVLAAIQRLSTVGPGPVQGKEPSPSSEGAKTTEQSTGRESTDAQSMDDKSKTEGTDDGEQKASQSSEKKTNDGGEPDENGGWMGQAALAMFVVLGLSVLGGP